MKLAVWQAGARTTFGLVDDKGGLFDVPRRSDGRWRDIGTVIAQDAMAEVMRLATGKSDAAISEVQLHAPIAAGGKVICVGVNYPERNAEFKDGSEQPKYPSLFPRFATSFVGHGANLVRPPESTQLDYEGEIVLVIGKRGRRIPEHQAHSHVFGLTLMNEGSIRDWLRHGKFNVTQGKNFERSGAIGPWIVPLSAATPLEDLTVTTHVNGEQRQRGNTGTLLFPIARLINYISAFTTLEPGDLIATGTPPGAGARLDPPRWLNPGDRIDIACPAIGTLSNGVEDEAV